MTLKEGFEGNFLLIIQAKWTALISKWESLEKTKNSKFLQQLKLKNIWTNSNEDHDVFRTYF